MLGPALLLFAAGCSSEAEGTWSQVESLRLPGATFEDVTKALGEFDGKAFAQGKTAYYWYPVSYAREPAQKDPEEWYMFQLTVDSRNREVIAFERKKPVVSEDGSLKPISVESLYRDAKGKWHAGSPPPDIVPPWLDKTINPLGPRHDRR
jgi:hypothetical protein